VLDPIKFPLAI